LTCAPIAGALAGVVADDESALERATTNRSRRASVGVTARGVGVGVIFEGRDGWANEATTTRDARATARRRDDADDATMGRPEHARATTVGGISRAKE
jgi:hypothetical protein